MRKHRLWAAALAVGLGTLASARAFGQLVAFPGAEGFGATAIGGRGGSVYVVTNFNQSGPGSFPDAVGTANRIVVFAVGGYFNASSAVSVASNVTILGQTAPGQGFGISGHELSLSESSNDIVQFIRAREGSADTSAKASINIGDATNTILDHVSAEYSQYDNIDAVGNNSTLNNVTVQNSIIADGIKAQQFNMHTEGSNVTYLNNVWANAHGRSALSKANDQFVNNVVYDYGYAYGSGNTAGLHTHDVIGNYFIAGPSTTSAGDAWFQLSTNDSVYALGNMLDSNKDGVMNGSASAPGGVTNLSSPWSPTTQYLPILSASAAYTFDIAHAGPTLNGRDTVDSQIISQVQSLGTAGSIYNTNADTGLSNGGFGTITGGTSPTSTAKDGIPDSWALTHGLSITDTTSAMKLSPLGYDMIEEYAQQLGDQYPGQTWAAASGNWISNAGNWSATVPGDYDHALIRGNGTSNGSVTISGTNAASAFSISIGGNGPVAGESLLVNGGSLMVYDTIYVGDQNNGSFQISAGSVRTNNVQLGNTVWNATGTSSTTYTGILSLMGGTLNTGEVSLGGGTPSNWTTGGYINWNGGTLQAQTVLTVNAPATLGSSGGILDTNNGIATISGVMSGSGFFKVIGGGSASLTGLNTYTGPTIISGATLNIPTLTNAGSAGALGSSSNAATNLVLDGGTFAGVGSTDRLFTLTANGGTLNNSGGMNFTNTGAIALPAANVTLTLTGTNIGHETFSPTLSDPGSGLATTVIKFGAGKWTFNSTGTKTYSGDTDVLAGTLETLANNALSPNSNLVISLGATFEMHDYSSVINALEGAGTVTDSFDRSSDVLTIGAANGSGIFTGSLGNGTLPTLIKIGAGTQVLAGTDTYTGTTTITGGVLQFNLPTSIGGGGASVTIAAGATDAAGYAMDQPFLARITSASAGTAALAISSSNNLDFSNATGANLANVSLGAVGSVSFTGTLTPFATTYRLGGGGGTLTLPNVQLTGANNVVVAGAGTVSATAANSYTGITTITNGGTFAPTLALGGFNSGMGQSSNAAANLILDSGTLKGSGTTDRSFTLTANGGTLDNSNTVSFTGPGSVVVPGSTNVILTLTGSSTAHNLFNLGLADAGGGTATSVVKAGVGKWTFSADAVKTYSGDTHIMAGQLEALSGDAFSHNSNLVIDSGASLEMHDNNVTVNGLQGGGAIYNSFTAGTHTLTIGAANGGGIWAGNVNSAATLNLVKEGAGIETFSSANAYVGNTTITGGTLNIGSTGSLISTAIYVSAGATFNLSGSVPTNASLTTSGTAILNASSGLSIYPVTLGAITLSSGGSMIARNSTLHSGRTLLTTTALGFGGSLNNWQGKVDLGGNDLIVNNGGLANLTNQVKQGYAAGTWTGTGGIVSSLAASDVSHLTTLGVIQNSVDGTTSGTALYGSGTNQSQFDGSNPLATDVLVKYTYYGDTNLDGKVDGSDYSRIDSGYLSHLTGWYNGDFNYDGVVDGSDYTLIDNAFNTQDAALSDLIASPTANITDQVAAPAAVPEPATIGIAAVSALGLLRRRPRRILYRDISY